MTIDYWGLGLQTVNVLILVWLLSRIFWRPVAAAISRRQDAAHSLMSDAEAAQAKADAALADVAKTRAGLAAEQEARVAEAAKKTEAAAKASLSEAREKAEKLVDAARLTREREASAAHKENAAKSARLAVDIAQKLLERLDTGEVQAAFLGLLIRSIEAMPATDRAALVAATNIDLASARELSATDKAAITKAIRHVLGEKPALTFITDPDLIAGFEMRTAHFVLHNSWRSDLATILKGVTDAA